MMSSRVICGHIEPHWKPGIISELKDRVDLWKIKLPDDLTIPTEIEAVLNNEEHQTASRFYQAKDRQNFTIRRGVLRILLAGYLGVKASEIEFIKGENKKPFVNKPAPPGIHFNVSHSGEWALIGISDYELGVDIEEFRASFNYQEILHQGFSSQEIEFITSSESPAKNFFQLWTRKEALIKATAKGVDDDLDKIPGLDGSHDVNAVLLGSTKNWTVKSFNVEKMCQASIAYSDYNSSINFLNFPITNYLA